MHACACTRACTHPGDVTLLQKETQTGTPSVLFRHLHVNHFPALCFPRPRLTLCFYLRGFFFFIFQPSILSFIQQTHGGYLCTQHREKAQEEQIQVESTNLVLEKLILWFTQRRRDEEYKNLLRSWHHTTQGKGETRHAQRSARDREE